MSSLYALFQYSRLHGTVRLCWGGRSKEKGIKKTQRRLVLGLCPAPEAWIEHATKRLTAARSAAELLRNGVGIMPLPGYMSTRFLREMSIGGSLPVNTRFLTLFLLQVLAPVLSKLLPKSLGSGDVHRTQYKNSIRSRSSNLVNSSPNPSGIPDTGARVGFGSGGGA